MMNFVSYSIGRNLGVLGVLGFAVSLLVFSANSLQAQQVQRHLNAGEFRAAMGFAGQVPVGQRDGVLAQIAGAQGFAGESTAAGSTMRGIGNPGNRNAALDEAGGAGGGSFADFQSLIDLIQTTVVPDTWEALGGPSTMAPYPQGVYVDSQGTVRECESLADDDAVADLRSLLTKSDEAQQDSVTADWQLASSMRCISLRRLLDEWTRAKMSGHPIPESILHMAGISSVQYLFINEDDVVIAGPVGGIESYQGWYRDRETGLCPLRLDFLATCLSSAIGNRPFGCTIDPTREGLQRSAAVAVSVQTDEIPIGKAAEHLVSALGMQRVEVFGTAGDTPVGYLMVEADRHMKQLALGIHPMPRGAKSYLDVIDATIAKGPPNELLLRLWFTSKPRRIRADANRKVFEIAGTPIRLSGQNERAVASGQRGHVTRDFRTEAFVESFNENWVAIRSQYPIYAGLESVFRSASVAELVRRFGEERAVRTITESLADAKEHSYLMPTPRQVESIAKLHHVRSGKKRHNILIASGGVSVKSPETVPFEIESYPSLASMTPPKKSRPKVIQRWWWNTK